MSQPLDDLAPTTTTHHFLERAAQRRIRPEVLQFILVFGTIVRASGATHLTVFERDLPAHLRGTPLAQRAQGWIVLQTDSGKLLTCYRRPDASRFLRRKWKRKLSRAQLWRRRARPGGMPSEFLEATGP